MLFLYVMWLSNRTIVGVSRSAPTDFVRYDVKLSPLLSGESLKENIMLQPNDVLTVR